MRWGTLLLAIVAIIAAPIRARAGAWTQPEGHTQILFGMIYSHAAIGFDNHGRPSIPLGYSKMLVQLDAEYGWNNWLTLLGSPEYTHADFVKSGGQLGRDDAVRLGGGARVRLLKDFGIVSVQVTAKAAGAFDSSVASDRPEGRQIEFRVLYGTGFSLFGHHGFFDAELGQRWIAGGHTNEIPIDLTLGLRVTKTSRVFLQSFNTLGEGKGAAPYGYYRVHKLSMSVVTRLRPGLFLESGSFYTVAGQNALAERGFNLRVWVEF
jgi:hypothetical protein